MNIAFGKIGKAIKFDSKKWSAIGGDNEATLLLLKMAKDHPEDNFYVIQRSDLKRCPEIQAEYPNIIDFMSDFTPNVPGNHTHIIDKMNRLNVKFDYCVLYNGICGTWNIKGVMYKNRKGEIKPTSSLMFQQTYAAPMIHMLNTLNDLKWMLLVPDSRYFPLMAHDLSHPADHVLGQINLNNATFCVHRDYMTCADTPYKCNVSYSGIENMFLIDKKRPDHDTYVNSNRTHKMNIVLNQGGNGGLDRYEPLRQYVLDNFDDVTIYGKWNDDIYGSDSRFAGPKRVEEIENVLRDTKYTFIIPITKDFATAKFCEMTHYGILPFMHPYYDTQKNIKCNDFLRVSSPQQLKERIDELENNPELYKQLLEEQYNLYNDDVYSGKTIIEDQIYNIINKDLN